MTQFFFGAILFCMTTKKPAKKTIKIACEAKVCLPLSSLQDFQGNLKTRTPQQLQQIQTSIEKYGFSFPFFVWKQGKKNWCLDGHGRMATLQQMQAEGWTVPALPVAYVQAKDRAEAKQKLLRMNSAYGDWDTQGVQDFLADIDVELSEIFIPEVATALSAGESFDVETAWEGMPEYEKTGADVAPYRSIVVHFNSQADVDLFAKIIEQKINEKQRFLYFPPVIPVEGDSVIYG